MRWLPAAFHDAKWRLIIEQLQRLQFHPCFHRRRRRRYRWLPEQHWLSSHLCQAEDKKATVTFPWTPRTRDKDQCICSAKDTPWPQLPVDILLHLLPHCQSSDRKDRALVPIAWPTWRGGAGAKAGERERETRRSYGDAQVMGTNLCYLGECGGSVTAELNQQHSENTPNTDVSLPVVLLESTLHGHKQTVWQIVAISRADVGDSVAVFSLKKRVCIEEKRSSGAQWMFPLRRVVLAWLETEQFGPCLNQRRTETWQTASFPSCVLNYDICLRFTSVASVMLGPGRPTFFCCLGDVTGTVVWMPRSLGFEALKLWCFDGAELQEEERSQTLTGIKCHLWSNNNKNLRNNQV